MDLFGKVKDYGSDFTTYPLTFEKYKWYKPLLVGILTGIFFFIFSFILYGIVEMMFPGIGQQFQNFDEVARAGFDSIIGVVTSIELALLIPALYLATRVVKDRPFSSYLSSVKWDWPIFARSFAVVAAVYFIINLLQIIFDGSVQFDFKLTWMALLAILIITPFQCFAEELIFRGWLMQTVGSWIKVPVVAIIIQGVIFSYIHQQYNLFALLSVIFTGIIVLPGLTWYSRGLEASTAFHTVNNIFSFIFAGITVQGVVNNLSLVDGLFAVVSVAIPWIVLILIDRKFGWVGLRRVAD